jgi:hypothetical protein
MQPCNGEAGSWDSVTTLLPGASLCPLPSCSTVPYLTEKRQKCSKLYLYRDATTLSGESIYNLYICIFIFLKKSSRKNNQKLLKEEKQKDKCKTLPAIPQLGVSVPGV